MFKLLRFCVCLLFVVEIGTANAGGYNFRLATFLPSTHLSNQAVLNPFSDNVRYSSGGMLSIKIFASGELGSNPREQLVLVEKGVADIALILPWYHPELFAELDVVSLPNLFRTATQGSLALTRIYERGLIKGFNSFIALSLFTTHPAILHCDRQIKSIKDLQGLRIRVANQMLADAMEVLGARPERLPSSETYQALQRGTFDGVTLSWRAMWEAKIHEVARFHYEMPLGATPSLLVMNRYRFDELPSRLREELKRHAGEQLAETWGKAYDQVNKLYKQRLQEQGHTIVRPSSPDNRRMHEISKRIVSRWSLKRPRRAEIVEAFSREVDKLQ